MRYSTVLTRSPEREAQNQLVSFGFLTKNRAQWQLKAASCRTSVPILIPCNMTSVQMAGDAGSCRDLCTGALVVVFFFLSYRATWFAMAGARLLFLSPGGVCAGGRDHLVCGWS